MRRRPVFKDDLRMLLLEAGGSAHVQGRAVRVLTTCHCTDSCAQARRSHDDRGTSPLWKTNCAVFACMPTIPPSWLLCFRVTWLVEDVCSGSNYQRQDPGSQAQSGRAGKHLTHGQKYPDIFQNGGCWFKVLRVGNMKNFISGSCQGSVQGHYRGDNWPKEETS